MNKSALILLIGCTPIAAVADTRVNLGSIPESLQSLMLDGSKNRERSGGPRHSPPPGAPNIRQRTIVPVASEADFRQRKDGWPDLSEAGYVPDAISLPRDLNPHTAREAARINAQLKSRPQLNPQSGDLIRFYVNAGRGGIPSQKWLIVSFPRPWGHPIRPTISTLLWVDAEQMTQAGKVDIERYATTNSVNPTGALLVARNEKGIAYVDLDRAVYLNGSIALKMGLVGTLSHGREGTRGEITLASVTDVPILEHILQTRPFGLSKSEINAIGVRVDRFQRGMPRGYFDSNPEESNYDPKTDLPKPTSIRITATVGAASLKSLILISLDDKQTCRLHPKASCDLSAEPK